VAVFNDVANTVTDKVFGYDDEFFCGVKHSI
jgi:hypothetical protein